MTEPDSQPQVVPTYYVDLADLIAEQQDAKPQNGRGVNELWDRLLKQEGQGRATELWAAACRWNDDNAEVDAAVTELADVLGKTLDLVHRARLHVDLLDERHIEYQEGGAVDVPEHVATALRSLRAAQALHAQATR